MKKLTIITLTFVMAVLSILPAFASSIPDWSGITEDLFNDDLFGNVTLEKMMKVNEFIEKYGYTSAVVTDRNGNELDTDAYIPTGAKCLEAQGDTVVTVAVICVMEDVNCDAKITAADARLALRHSARLEKLDDIQFKAADVNMDGKVTAADARLILRKPIGPVNPNG